MHERMAWAERLRLYAKLVRLDKPIGILLLLWPTLWALWIASNGKPSLYVLTVFVVGTVLMRSAGCAINDWADRDFDRHVVRTAERPLTSGRISGREALMVAAVLALLALLLILPLDGLTLALSVVAVFVAASYPFTKRFFALPQAYLGIAFGFGIPMAFAAIEGRVPLVGWVLLAANVFWALAYDTEYAMVDRDDDVRLGLHTSAITFGAFDVSITMLCYAMALFILAAIGLNLRFGWAYFAGLAVAGAMAVYHYRLIRTRSREGCFKAFMHNNWLGAAIFAGIAADHAIRLSAWPRGLIG